MYDVIVIGAGPAGLAAAVYTLQHHLSTMVVAPDLAGKAIYRLQLPWVQGHEVITGEETMEQLRQRLISTESATRYVDVVERVFQHNHEFQVITGEGGAFQARSVIVASGVTPHLLGVPGEQRLMGYGVSYSATSHMPLFRGRRVVVVGSDLRALRAAAELRLFAEHVTLIGHDHMALDGYALGRRLLHDERVTLLPDHAVVEIVGETAVSGVIAATSDGETQLIAADGVFIEHGLTAHTSFLGALVERTTSGQIVVNDRGATRIPGLFAAGDVTSTAYAEQMLIAFGEGAKAGLSACAYLLEGISVQMP